MRRLVSAVLLFAAMTLAVPSTSNAAVRRHTRRHAVVIRVYDPYRHDYHRWDRDEERAYRQYLNERHRTYVSYRRQKAAERRAYWHWRHERQERLEHERR